MIKQFFSGISAYGNALNLLSKLKLWKYFFVPILISFFTGALFFTAAYFASAPIGRFIAKAWIWEWGAEGFLSVSIFIGGLLVFAVGLILYKHVVMALSAPFMSPVSEKIEAYMTGTAHHNHRKTSFAAQLIRGLRINMRNLLKELLFMIPLLILSFIPIIGIIGTFLIFIMQAYYVGFGNMDYTMERHFGYKESLHFVKKNRGTAMGNGAVFIVMLFIPVLGFIITLPIAVVAATTEMVKLLQKENLINIATNTTVDTLQNK
ncbi:EI24 domain-containing protein [Aquimarina intermedia]|uniref:CysZ protein n=1 Tax=Aquimarina intermedia TaxID=350814 RepID=A0A5S5CC67_9FLAO|nr:EI24 domain-containing protein [Aquimarina intermedia]TYP76238.1 CysZ protein [Aquimarina intermedia]